jgi:arylsulfatase
MFKKKWYMTGLLILGFFTSGLCSSAESAQNVADKKPVSALPNILIIWGDDIGWFNVSAYNRGMMGYRTPNIDSIAENADPTIAELSLN